MSEHPSSPWTDPDAPDGGLRSPRRRLDPLTLVVAALACVLALVGCVMIVRGLPMRTPTERWLLDLSSLPLSLAVVLVVVRVAVERGLLRHRPAGAPLPRLLLAGAVLVGLGLLGWVLVLAGVGAGVLTPAAVQVLVWLGVGAWVLWIVRDGQRRDRVTAWRLLDDD
ncbi:hypothetical protein [Auraticoccus monumenti]|uniref:Uncharacterized protein n=1 Tax=Auraticoccus monumenti TaxID=675864 RepID=A0A1G6XWP0_9ACTN|nr:hypothetical protein [Auraticoccus monumenti]SDD81815.1 hypothetical protein SAMN04489747_1814 [Auraticoccus monumenti]